MTKREGPDLKKWFVLVVLFIAAAGGGYAIHGGYTPFYHSDKKGIREQTRQFWEFIRFKSFDQAAQFDEDEDKETTARLIERIFRIKPENLDIQRVDVLSVEIDSSGNLGRSKARLEGELLNPKKTKTIEVMLFWRRVGGVWRLKLRSSLD